MSGKGGMAQWHANIYTGFVVLLPAVVAIAIVIWLVGALSNLTNKVLFFLKWLPDSAKVWVYQMDANGDYTTQVHWWWSIVTFVVVLIVIGLIGRMTRWYLGKKILELVDFIILRVPLLNRIYAAVKQVNEALMMKNDSSFQQVVAVEFPGPGMHSIGFITGESHEEISFKLEQEAVSVFVSTTPNPTTGFLVFMPRDKVTKLDMSVAEGIKYIISLGSVSPQYPTPPTGRPAVDKLAETDGNGSWAR